MSFTKSTVSTNNIQSLADQVKEQAAALKLAFDQYGIDDKAYINSFIDELEAKTAAASVGAADYNGQSFDFVQEWINYLKDRVDETKPTVNVYSVLDYGLTGLGVADDAIAWNTLLTTIGAKESTVLFPALTTGQATYLISTNVVVPDNVNLVFNQGAVLKVSNTFSVTSNGAKLTAGPYKIFDLSLGGTIEGTWDISEGYAEWMGALGDDSTDDSGLIISYLSSFKKLKGLPNKIYLCDAEIPLAENYTVEGSDLTTVYKFTTGIKGFTGSGAVMGVTLANFKLKGTNITNAAEKGIEIIGHATSGFPKLVIRDLQVEDFGDVGVHIENGFDASLSNINSSGNKGNGFEIINGFAGKYEKLVAYQNAGFGFLVQSAAGSVFTGDAQENDKNGLLVESAKGCTFNMYLEQNGWNTVTDAEKAQFRLTQRSGGFKPSSGNNITCYFIGGKGSTVPTKESKYGIYLDFAYRNIVNGNYGGHLLSDVYFTSNSKNNQMGVVEHETGLAGGDTPTPVTNNGLMNGYVPVSTVKDSRIETLSFASQAAARNIVFTKAFVSAPKIVGTVVSTVSTAAAIVKINNVTTTDFDFVVTDGTALVVGAQVNFIAIGE